MSIRSFFGDLLDLIVGDYIADVMPDYSFFLVGLAVDLGFECRDVTGFVRYALWVLDLELVTVPYFRRDTSFFDLNILVAKLVASSRPGTLSLSRGVASL